MPIWTVTLSDHLSFHPAAAFEAEAETRVEAAEMIRALMLTPGVPQGLVMARETIGAAYLTHRLRKVKATQEDGPPCKIGNRELMCRMYDQLTEFTELTHLDSCTCYVCVERARLRNHICERQAREEA